MTTVVSFDVFDTVLTRLSGPPDEVLVRTGRRLRDAGVTSLDPASYAAARAQALQDLTADPALHPTLDQVAAELAARLGLPEGAAAQLVAAELDIEREVCRAAPGAAERVAAGRRRTGRGAVFVSDTSMPADFLEELLRREQLFLDGDQLFTSCAARASKQDGGLFDVVAAELGVAAAEISHEGDDRWSDLVHARQHGWTATLDDSGALSSRELDLARRSAVTDGLGARFAGAARIGRLQARADGSDAGVASIAGAVALPLLAGFGLWVLRQAQLHELDRLYFVARDGEIFREVTGRLAEQAGLDLDCRYLYGSRRAWQLAAAGTATHERAGRLWLPDDTAGEELSARAAVALVDLDLDEARTLVVDPLLVPERADAPLGEAGWRRFRELLTAGPLGDEGRRRARTRRDLLVRYLDQAEVTAPGRVGFVDVGWTGRAARALEDVLVDAQRPLPAAHLFVGMLGPAPDLMGADLHARSHGWLIDESRGRRSHAGSDDPVMLIESFAMGREGNTLGLALEGDTVVPVLRSQHNPAAQRWEFEGYRESLRVALDALCDGPPLDTGVDLRSLAWAQLLSFWRRPDRAEARAWGAQPYGEDFANEHVHPLATPVTAKRLLARLRVGRPEWREPTYWLPGTIALSPPVWRTLLSVVELVGQRAGRARRIPARVRAELTARRRR